jgi:hypothetical protein
VEEDKNRPYILFARSSLELWCPDVERETVLALQSAKAARKGVDDALGLECKAGKGHWFGNRLGTIAKR